MSVAVPKARQNHWWLELGINQSHGWCWPADVWARSEGYRALVFLGLVPYHWWMKLGPRVSGCRALGVLDLVPVHWCVRPAPGPSGGWGQVQGQLWAQGILRKPVDW